MKIRKRFEINGWRERLFIAAFILLILGLLSFVLFQSAVKPFRTEYKGLIVDKSLDIHEDQTGSRIELFLLIKDDHDRTFNVVVDQELYDRARIGMHIERTKEGTVLWDK